MGMYKFLFLSKHFSSVLSVLSSDTEIIQLKQLGPFSNRKFKKKSIECTDKINEYTTRTIKASLITDPSLLHESNISLLRMFFGPDSLC